MFHVKPKTALLAFRLVYVAFIVSASATTLLSAGGAQHAAHVAILAGVEIAAALGFLLPATEVAACGVLLVVYAIATALSLAMGEWTLRFLYYAATAVFIVSLSRARAGRSAAA